MASKLRPTDPACPQQYLAVFERIAQLERRVENNRKDMQAKLDHFLTGRKEELYQIHHQMKQAAAL